MLLAVLSMKLQQVGMKEDLYFCLGDMAPSHRDDTDKDTFGKFIHYYKSTTGTMIVGSELPCREYLHGSVGQRTAMAP